MAVDQRKMHKPGKDFRIIGGGIIGSITNVDDKGNKSATITRGFKLIQPLKKGDPFLEEFQWQKKIKPGIGWKGFWTNYGILEIEEEDFWGLVGDVPCMPGIASSDLGMDSREDDELIKEIGNGVMSADQPPVVNQSPIDRTEPIKTQGKVYPRNKQVARNALRNANYLCECNGSHQSFIRRGTTVLYCEPHHLVPMGFQDAFKNSLDREENIVALCSNCHNQIHYGEGAKELITKLYNQRNADLKRVGIDVDLETLLLMYGLGIG